MKDGGHTREDFLEFFNSVGETLSSLELFVLKWISDFYDPYDALAALGNNCAELRFDPRNLYEEYAEDIWDILNKHVTRRNLDGISEVIGKFWTQEEFEEAMAAKAVSVVANDMLALALSSDENQASDENQDSNTNGQ